jgi:hypothetical protein
MQAPEVENEEEEEEGEEVLSLETQVHVLQG